MVLNRRFLIYFIIFLSFLSCKKENKESNLDFNYTYFPLEEGNFISYNVDSINYNDFSTPVLVTRNNYQIKEVVADEFIDLEGRPSHRIERFYRKSNDEEWAILNVYYATLNERTAEKIEENQRFIKLVFPVGEGKQWMGNKFVDPSDELFFLKDWKYEMKDVNKPLVFGSLSFDSTLVVLQKYDSSAINITSSVEKYAKNVGLIYKELRFLKSQNNIGLPWEERAEQGYILRMSIIDYGKE